MQPCKNFLIILKTRPSSSNGKLSKARKEGHHDGEKKEAAVLAHNDPKALNPEDIVATFESAVNRNDLNAALAAVGLSTKRSDDTPE